MANTIDMKDLRHLNLFQKITQIRTRHIFNYNDMVYFCVPKNLLSKALGKDVENLRKISGIVKKRIRVIPIPKGPEHAKDFVRAVVDPVQFKEIEVTPTEIIVKAGTVQNKAGLLGRNKKRLEDMKKIIQNYFQKEYRIE